MKTKNCYGCPDHKLGCKSTCESWKDHEDKKEERYKVDKIQRNAGLRTRTVLYYNDYRAKNKARTEF
jgi:hypothetical protein